MGVLEMIEKDARKARFWPKVDIQDDNSCWSWRGSHDQRGYGQFWDKGRRIKAHRMAWQLFNGQPFPEGKEACHTCDNPNCVNPRHIWPGTHRENIKDAVDKKRVIPPAPKTREQLPEKMTCPHGHPYSDENTYINANGAKVCRECARIARTKYNRRIRRSTV